MASDMTDWILAHLMFLSCTAYAALNDGMTTNEMRKDMEGTGGGLFQEFIEGKNFTDGSWASAKIQTDLSNETCVLTTKT